MAGDAPELSAQERGIVAVDECYLVERPELIEFLLPLLKFGDVGAAIRLGGSIELPIVPGNAELGRLSRKQSRSGIGEVLRQCRQIIM